MTAAWVAHEGWLFNLGALCAALATVSMAGPLMQEPHLQKRLQQVLKLNKEKWEEAREHALKAVVVDNRMRVWWASQASGTALRVGVHPPCIDRRPVNHACQFGMYDLQSRPNT